MLSIHFEIEVYYFSDNVTETRPVSLRLPTGSVRNPQTGAPDSARLDACSSHQRVCVFR